MSSEMRLNDVTYEPGEGTITATFVEEFYVGRGCEGDAVYESGNNSSVQTVTFYPNTLIIDNKYGREAIQTDHVLVNLDHPMIEEEDLMAFDKAVEQKMEGNNWYLDHRVDGICGGVLRDLDKSAVFDIELEIQPGVTWTVVYSTQW